MSSVRVNMPFPWPLHYMNQKCKKPSMQIYVTLSTQPIKRTAAFGNLYLCTGFGSIGWSVTIVCVRLDSSLFQSIDNSAHTNTRTI